MLINGISGTQIDAAKKIKKKGKDNKYLGVFFSFYESK